MMPTGRNRLNSPPPPLSFIFNFQLVENFKRGWNKVVKVQNHLYVFFASSQARLAVERELLEADTGMLSNEKEKLLAELSAKESALKAEVENRQRMAARISALESKLLCGNGESMVERTNEQQVGPLGRFKNT